MQSDDCSDQGHSADQRGRWRQGMCSVSTEAPVQGNKLQLQFCFCTGHTVTPSQRSGHSQRCGLNNHESAWGRGCSGCEEGIPGGPLKATGISSRTRPLFFSLRVAEASFWFSDSDRGFDLDLKSQENLPLIPVRQRKMIHHVLGGRKRRCIHKQSS